MSDSIKLSPKHGVNPCIPICFWCGKEKNEVAMLGKIGGRGEDIKAPRSAILNYEPCEDCLKAMETGITFIEYDEKPVQEGMPSLLKEKEVYPTSAWSVIKEEALDYLIIDDELREQIKKSRKCFTTRQDYESLFGNGEDADESNNN